MAENSKRKRVGPTGGQRKRGTIGNTPPPTHNEILGYVPAEDEQDNKDIQDIQEDQKVQALPGPCNLAQMFKWPSWYLHQMCKCHSPSYVLNVLKSLKWHVTTAFSGMGCPEIALEMIAAGVKALGPDFSDINLAIKYGTSVDKNKECRKVLMENCKDRCVFGDILDWVAKGKSMRSWELKEVAACERHQKQCHIMAPSNNATMIKVMVAGPPCTPWSKRGKRKGNKDPQAQTHLVWAKFVLLHRFDIVIFECVYDTEVLSNVEKTFGQEYHIKHGKVSAESLGFCVSRVRLYVIMHRKGKLQWSQGVSKMSDKSFEDLLVPFARSVSMSVKDTFHLEETELKAYEGCWDPSKSLEEKPLP